MTTLQIRTYEALRKIPQGRVTTYKLLAQAVGTKAYRAIGQFMKNNPFAYTACTDRSKRVPCHRVVASDGSIGGFKGKKSGTEIREKIALLRNEGIECENGKVIRFHDVCMPVTEE